MRLQKSKSGKLTRRMFFSLILAVIFGLGIIMLRENLLSSGKASVWNTINHILFADISADGNEKAIGLFYIIGQLFVKSLQVIIVPMVFTSIVLAIIRITDSRKLGRIASRTICYFLITTLVSIIYHNTSGTL